MKQLLVKGEQGDSQIIVGETLSNLSKYIPEKKVLIITDSKVRKLYGHYFFKFPVIEIAQGEKNKTLASVERIVSEMLSLGVDRSWFIVAVGGGIVCDVAGFIASIYMRGIRFGFVATTLLAQVDASVGGKNGVNFQGYKNILGVFNQPEFVICDPTVLDTLSDEDILCGIAEIIKHAFVASEEMFNKLEAKVDDVLFLDDKLLSDLIFQSIKIKSEVVNEDEKEQGKRKILNFGHTLGHAIEKLYRLPHGKAVGAGMHLAINLSVQKGFLEKTVANKMVNLLNSYKLFNIKIDKGKLFSAITKDKKKDGDAINFVYLKQIGSPKISKVKLKDLKEDIYELFKHSL